MGRMALGILIGILLGTPSLCAFRMAKPPTFTEWTPNSFAQLNAVLDDLWQITNGRYTKEIVTANPNGSRRGDPGDMVLYNSSGTYKPCWNTSSSAGGTTWRCNANALTVP